MDQRNVLFLCTSNSGRSQMAEMWLKHLGDDQFEVKSAGLEPGRLNPLAVEAMSEVGIDMSRNPTRSVFDVFKSCELLHYVITVCDQAKAEKCAIFGGVTRRLHWRFPDPAQVTGSPEAKLDVFRQVWDAIRERIAAWCEELAALPTRM